MLKLMHDKRGFTFVELMITVVIVGCTGLRGNSALRGEYEAHEGF